MPSIHNEMMRRSGQPSNVAHFGESGVALHTPALADPIRFGSAAVSRLNPRQTEDERGNVRILEQCTVDVAASLIPEIALPLTDRDTLAIPQYAGAPFTVDPDETNYAAAVIRISAHRAPLTRRNESRADASV